MEYLEFKKKIIRFPVIRSRDMERFKEDKQILRNQFLRWQKKGLIYKLKKGIYILNENDRKTYASPMFIANQLYSPSYVSLEYALGHYDLIPEKVIVMTSVTTKKTADFFNVLGRFEYRHMRPEVFRGFKGQKDQYGFTFFIAEPEKAMVDFFYFNLARFKADDKDIFELSYRFQNTEVLRRKNILRWAELFDNDKLLKVARLFCEFMKEEKGRYVRVA